MTKPNLRKRETSERHTGMLLQGGLMCNALLVIFLFYNYKVCACQILEYVGKKDDPISILSIITHCTKCQV